MDALLKRFTSYCLWHTAWMCDTTLLVSCAVADSYQALYAEATITKYAQTICAEQLTIMEDSPDHHTPNASTESVMVES